MRIKIKNQFSRKAMCDAYEQAIAYFEATHPKFTFSQINLYFLGKDAKGRTLDVLDQQGQPLFVTLGDNTPPSLTPARLLESQEIVLRRTQQEISIRLADIAPDYLGEVPSGPRLYWDRPLDKFDETPWEKKQRQLENMAFIQSCEVDTSRLLASCPDDFISALNAIIEAVWSQYNPLIDRGTSVGQPQPMPSFSGQNGVLYLTDPSWVDDHQVSNPVARPLSQESDDSVVEPLIWRHEAWLKATSLMAEEMPVWAAKIKAQQDTETVTKREKGNDERRKWKEYKERQEQEALIADMAAREARTEMSWLIKTMPDEIVQALNEAIQFSWAANPPVINNGPLKGQPQPLPYFKIQEGELFLYSSHWKTPARRMPCPFYKVWANAAWADAMLRMDKVRSSMALLRFGDESSVA